MMLTTNELIYGTIIIRILELLILFRIYTNIKVMRGELEFKNKLLINKKL